MKGLSLFPHGAANSTVPGSQKNLQQSGQAVVTITHHKSPGAARKAKIQPPGHLHEVREVRNVCCFLVGVLNNTNIRSFYSSKNTDNLASGESLWFKITTEVTLQLGCSTAYKFQGVLSKLIMIGLLKVCPIFPVKKSG